MAVHTGTSSEALRAKRDRYVARGVAIAPIFAARAHGARLTDADGREYIDFAGGIGVLNLGHTPEAVVEAIAQQAAELIHACFPVAAYEPYLEVCRMLSDLAPGTGEKKAVLINSGAEAVENAVKIARYHTGRPAVITFDRGFHGRTLLAMSLTSKLVYKRGMGPFAPEIYRAPAPYPYRGIDTADALEALDWMFKATVDPASVACVILEPIQGEGGFTVMPAEFIQGLKARCEEHGILYIDDEVQAGMGRTGKFFRWENFGARPDIITMAKGLAGGIPIGAMLTGPRTDLFTPGDHGTTFGGNPIACAAGVATVSTIIEQNLLENAAQMGDYWGGKLTALSEKYAFIDSPRGLGLMRAVNVKNDMAPVIVQKALEHGLLLNNIGGKTLRMIPPLILTTADIDEAAGLLDQTLAEVAEQANA